MPFFFFFFSAFFSAAPAEAYRRHHRHRVTHYCSTNDKFAPLEIEDTTKNPQIRLV